MKSRASRCCTVTVVKDMDDEKLIGRSSLDVVVTALGQEVGSESDKEGGARSFAAGGDHLVVDRGNMIGPVADKTCVIVGVWLGKEMGMLLLHQRRRSLKWGSAR